jgi:hypothetical protein
VFSVVTFQRFVNLPLGQRAEAMQVRSLRSNKYNEISNQQHWFAVLGAIISGNELIIPRIEIRHSF